MGNRPSDDGSSDTPQGWFVHVLTPRRVALAAAEAFAEGLLGFALGPGGENGVLAVARSEGGWWCQAPVASSISKTTDSFLHTFLGLLLWCHCVGGFVDFLSTAEQSDDVQCSKFEVGCAKFASAENSA